MKRLKRETESSRSAVSVAVDAEDEAEAVAVSSSGTTRPPSSGKQKSASAAVPAMKAAQQWSGRLKIPAAVLVVAALIAGGLYVRSHTAKQLTEKDTIVLADLENSTGDSVFDDTLKQALEVDLGPSPFLNVLSERRIRETLRLMGRTSNDRVTRDVAQEICLRTGTKALISGSISRLGNEYMLALEAVNCGSGDALAKEQVEAATKEDAVRAVGKAAASLRTKLGESLASVQKFDVPASSGSWLRSWQHASSVNWKARGQLPPFIRSSLMP